MSALLKAAAAGVGAVLLPTFAAAQETGAAARDARDRRARVGLWLLSHPELRGNARVRALAAHLAQAVPQEIERLSGSGATCKAFAACPLAQRRRRVQHDPASTVVRV